MKLRNVHQEIAINTTPDKMWSVLSQYGDVSSFHAGVMESCKLEGSENSASSGCERICNLVDMGLNIMLKERIINYVEGKGYQYEVYEWKNFPVQKMLFSFAIKEGQSGKSVLRIDIDYKARPAFLTPLMIGKMKKLMKDVLLGYKHYAETGEKRVPIKALRKIYKNRHEPVLQQV